MQIEIGKKAGTKMIGRETVGLIIGLAVVVVLVLLMYSLIAPYFDKDKETAKSYFNTLKDEIEKADNGGGEFMIWQKEEDTNFYLVYFGENKYFDFGQIKFSSIGKNENHICICYVIGKETFCRNCKNLDLPVRTDYFEEMGESPRAVGFGEKLKITKEEGYYSFEKTD